MIKYYTNTLAVLNLYKKISLKSEIVTQLIYGESFSILKKNKKWLKIKIKEDNYKGYIQKKNYKPCIKPTHKIHKLKANIYKFPNKTKKIDEFSFGSKIMIEEKKFNYFKFEKGWINQNDVKPIIYKEKNFFKKIFLFKNVKYKWGGKSFKGIDCSALIQVCLNFNNIFCPRDTRDQNRYFKKKIKSKNIQKNDIIYWKGHVAVALSKKNLIHAYGPEKKTVIMNIDEAISRIYKTAKLKVLKITRI
tara:strand:- start:396 stop:1136 length:741 start_codon:yes stop_codon:yes gene_type:complete